MFGVLCSPRGGFLFPKAARGRNIIGVFARFDESSEQGKAVRTMQPNAELLLREVLDCTLRRGLEQLVVNQPLATLLDVRGEAIRWKRDGLPSSARERSNSAPSFSGIHYGVRSAPVANHIAHPAEVSEPKEILTPQLNRLTQTIAAMRHPPPTWSFSSARTFNMQALSPAWTFCKGMH